MARSKVTNDTIARAILEAGDSPSSVVAKRLGTTTKRVADVAVALSQLGTGDGKIKFSPELVAELSPPIAELAGESAVDRIESGLEATDEEREEYAKLAAELDAPRDLSVSKGSKAAIAPKTTPLGTWKRSTISRVKIGDIVSVTSIGASKRTIDGDARRITGVSRVALPSGRRQGVELVSNEGTTKGSGGTACWLLNLPAEKPERKAPTASGPRVPSGDRLARAVRLVSLYLAAEGTPAQRMQAVQNELSTRESATRAQVAHAVWSAGLMPSQKTQPSEALVKALREAILSRMPGSTWARLAKGAVVQPRTKVAA